MPEWAAVALVVLAAVLWFPFWWLMGGLHVLWTQRGMTDEEVRRGGTPGE